MKLTPGARLHDHLRVEGISDSPDGVVSGNQPIYTVTGTIAETPWHGLYTGKKIFRNFKFEEGRPEEADLDECLDVLLKSIVYTRCDDREYVNLRREQSRFEAKSVLGIRETNLLPEPLDVLRLRNDQDQFSFPRSGRLIDKEPVLVFEKIHGQDLATWKRVVQPSPRRVLQLLARLLQFMQQMHGKGLVLNGPFPAAIWVDEMDGPHYVASENIVNGRSDGAWRVMFPPERYAEGFFPPEVRAAGGRVDERCDLFAWSSLAYFLLTGDNPANWQRTSAARDVPFQRAHFQRLRTVLQNLPAVDIEGVAASLGVGGRRFVRSWPDSFVDVIEACLEANPDDRPSSVTTMREWWANAPPSPISFAWAIPLNDGTVEVLYSLEGVPASAQVVVRCAVGVAPKQYGDGAPVAEARPRWRAAGVGRIVISPRLPRPSGGFGVFYAVFSKVTVDGATAFSKPTLASQIDASRTKEVLSRIEQMPGAMEDPDQLLNAGDLPAALTPLVASQVLAGLATVLLGSRWGRVRRWGIALLRNRLLDSMAPAEIEEILWQLALRDSRFDLRLAAASALLRGEHAPQPELLIRLARAMVGENVDAQIRVVRSLQGCDVTPQAINIAVAMLEGNRLVRCHECQQDVRAAQRDAHLQTEHGYVLLDDRVLPLGDALKALWERMFGANDVGSARRLAELFTERRGKNSLDALGAAFVAQFSLRWRANGTSVAPSSRAGRETQFAHCLDAHELLRRLCTRLLSHDLPELRSLARAVLVPHFARRLSAESVAPGTFRQSVDALCPRDGPIVKIEACRQLAAAGASAAAAALSERALELDVEIACPICAKNLPRRELGRHTRLDHGVYEFRGSRYDLEQIKSRLLALVFGEEPDPDAARTLFDIFDEQLGSEPAVKRLAEVVGATSRAAHSAQNHHLRLPAAARSLAMLSRAPELAELLLAGRVADLGILIFSNLATAPGDAAIGRLVHCLGEPKIPVAWRSDALAAFLRLYGDSHLQSRNAVLQLANSAGAPESAVKLLYEVKKIVGKSATLQSVCSEMERSIVVKCPKCESTAALSEMRKHIWQVHALVLDGRLARKPWAFVEACIDDYLGDGDTERLRQAKEVASLVDPVDGSALLARMALRRGAGDEELIAALEERAAKVHASICCSCFDLVPSPRDAPVMRVEAHAGGSLTSDAYSIAVVPSRLRVESTIRTHAGSPVHELAASCRTKLGAALLAASAPLVGAFLLLPIVGMSHFRVMPFAVCMAIATAATFLVACILYRPKLTTGVDVAWQSIVPRLLDAEDDRVANAFIGGLAVASIGRGAARPRTSVVDRAIGKYTDLVVRRKAAYPYLGFLYRLALVDGIQLRHDAAVVELVRRLLHRCVDGAIPIDCLDGATENGGLLRPMPPRCMLALKWAICDAYLAARYSPADILALCERSATIRTVLATTPTTTKSVIANVAAIRDVWERHTAKRSPVPAETVFDLIQKGDLTQIERYPDLLAVSHDRLIGIVERGLVFHGNLFTSRPEVSWRPVHDFVQTGWQYQRKDGGPDRRFNPNPAVGYQKVVGFELSVAGKTWSYSSSPERLAHNLNILADIYFGAVQPLAAQLASQPARRTQIAGPESSKARCPACGQLVRFAEGRTSTPADDLFDDHPVGAHA
ncbi:MAG TPA: hypothetical protein VMV69_19795 [Pirellulales bacterium]|nr:hypothetical protein [Pirellulales bacterium]